MACISRKFSKSSSCAARVCQRVAQEEDFENFLLMHAMGANAAGQVASVVAGGVVLALMGAGG